MKEGYIIMYHCDRDECHIDLVDKTAYDNICAAMYGGGPDPADDALKAFCAAADPHEPGIGHVHKHGEVLERYMRQTMTSDVDWPYNDVNVLGTACIWLY